MRPSQLPPVSRVRWRPGGGVEMGDCDTALPDMNNGLYNDATVTWGRHFVRMCTIVGSARASVFCNLNPARSCYACPTLQRIPFLAMKILRRLSCALVLTVSLLPLAATDAADMQTQAHEAFSGAITKYDIPGLVVGVTHRGTHQFYVYGMASRADRVPVTPDTLFELGSVSKLFTATLAALAEQRGLLSLDMPASAFLCGNGSAGASAAAGAGADADAGAGAAAGASGRDGANAGHCTVGQNMTLMDLATHYSSGLPLQVPAQLTDTPAVIDWLRAWQPTAPGTRSYSNISIGLLGHITAQAMGMSYTHAIESVLLPALGMTQSWIGVPAAQMNRYAWGYDRKTQAPIRVTPGVLASEAYGMKSSARDMAAFMDVVLGEAIVSQEVAAAVQRTMQGQLTTAAFTQDMIWEQYAWPADLATMLAANSYDFIMTPQPAQRITPPLAPQTNVVLNKTGATNGFSAYVSVLPAEKLGVVILANRNFPNEARIQATWRLMNALLAQ